MFVSVILSRGSSTATLAFLENILYLKPLFIAMVSQPIKGSAPRFIRAGGILSLPTAFVGLRCWRHFLTLSLFTDEVILSFEITFVVTREIFAVSLPQLYKMGPREFRRKKLRV